MVNEIALVLLLGLFGWKVALLYLIAGLNIAMVSDWVIGKLRMERHIEGWATKAKKIPTRESSLSWSCNLCLMI